MPLLKDIKNCTSPYPAGQRVLSSCVFFPALSPFRKHPRAGVPGAPLSLARTPPAPPPALAAAALLQPLGLLGLGVGTDEDVAAMGSVLRVFGIEKVTIIRSSAGSLAG